MSELDHNEVASLLEGIAPVIYADGKRDDTSGWIAAVENRHVIYNSKLFGPNDDIFVDRAMRFDTSVCVMGENMPVPDYVDDDWMIAVVPKSSTREVSYIDDVDLRHALGDTPPVDLEDIADDAPSVKH